MKKPNILLPIRVVLGSLVTVAFLSAALAQGDHDKETIHTLLAANQKITRSVQNLPDGIEARTESKDPAVAKKIQEHVAAMKWRLEKKQPIRRGDPLFATIFENADKFHLVIKNTEKGVEIRETSKDAYAVKLLQAHAKAVSGFIHDGMPGMAKLHDVPQKPKLEDKNK